MEIIGDVFAELWKVWGEILKHIIEVAPKVFFFLLWAGTALIVLPAVFIAGNLYPIWEKWGEDF